MDETYKGQIEDEEEGVAGRKASGAEEESLPNRGIDNFGDVEGGNIEIGDSMGGLKKIQAMAMKILEKYTFLEHMEDIDLIHLNEETRRELESSVSRILDIEGHLEGGFETPTIYVKLGAALAFLGRYEDAINMFEKSTTLGYNQNRANAYIAFCRLRMEDYDTAKHMFEDILEKDDTIGLAWYGMGLLSEIEGNYPAAISMYKIATRTSPEAISPWLKLARAYEDIGRYQEAIRCYKTVVDIDRGMIDGWIGLTQGYLNLGQLDQAMKYAKKVLEIDSERADVWRLLGNIYEERGDVDEAMMCYKRADELAPTAETDTDKGNIYLRLYKFEEARDAYLRALKVNGADEEALRGISVAEGMLGHYDDALLYVKILLEINNTSIENRLTEADVHIILGHYKEGEERINAVLAENALTVPALERLGRLRVALLKLREGADAMLNVLDIDPKNEVAILYLHLVGHILKHKFIEEGVSGGEDIEYIKEAFETAICRLKDSIALHETLTAADVSLPLIERGIAELRGHLYLGDFKGARSLALKVHDDLVKRAEKEIERIINTARLRYRSMVEKGIKLSIKEDLISKVESLFKSGNIGESSKLLLHAITEMKETENDYERCVEMIYQSEGDIRNLETVGFKADRLKAELEAGKRLFEEGQYKEALKHMDALKEMFIKVKRRHKRILDGVAKIEEAKDTFKVENIDIKEIERIEGEIKGAMDEGDDSKAMALLEEGLKYVQDTLNDLERRKIENDIKATSEILLEIKGEGADVAPAEECLEDARKNLANNDFESAKDNNNRALEILLKAKDKLREKEVHTILGAISDVIATLKRYGEDVTQFNNQMANVRDLLSKGEYLKAKEAALELRRGALEALRGYTREIAKRHLKEAEDLFATLTTLSIKEEGVGEVNELLKNARTAMEYSDFTTAERDAKKAVEMANSILKAHYMEEMERWEARIRSLNDVIIRYGTEEGESDVGAMIAKVRAMVEEGRFQEAMEQAKNFRKEMKEKAKRYFRQAAEDEIKRAEALIKQLETDHSLDLTSEKKELFGAREALKYEDYENALFYAREAMEHAKLKEEEHLKGRYGTALEEMDKQISLLKDLGVLKDSILEERKKIEQLTSSGRFKMADVGLKELGEKIESALNKGIKDFVRKIEAGLKPMLYSMKSKGIDIDEYEEHLNAIKNDMGSGGVSYRDIYERIVSINADVKARFDAIAKDELITDIKEIQEEVEELEKKGQDMSAVRSRIAEALRSIDRGDYNAARDVVKIAKSLLFEKGRRFLKERYKKDLEECFESLQELKGLGIDVTTGERLIAAGENHLKFEDFDAVKDALRQIRKYIADRLEEHQQMDARSLLDSLKRKVTRIKDMGGDTFEMDIMLKQAEEAFNGAEYVRARSIAAGALEVADKRLEKYILKDIQRELRAIHDKINIVKAMGYPEDECIPLEVTIEDITKAVDNENISEAQKLLETLKDAWRKLLNNALLNKIKDIYLKVSEDYDRISGDADALRAQKKGLEDVKTSLEAFELSHKEGDGVMAMYHILKARNALNTLNTIYTLNQMETIIADIKSKIDKVAKSGIDTKSLESRLREVQTKIIGLVPTHPKSPIVLREAMKKIKDIDAECEDILVRTKLDMARAEINNAEEMISELRSIGINVSEAEGILSNAKEELRAGEGADSSVEIISKAINSIELATKASDIALSILRDHQTERARTMLKHAEEARDDLRELDIPTNTIDVLINEARELIEKERYVEAAGLAEQAIERANIEKKRLLLERSRKAIEECSKRLEEMSAKGLSLSHLNNLIIEMKQKFARDEFSEVLNLSLRFNKLADEEEEALRRRDVEEKINELREFVSELSKLGADVGTIEMAVGDLWERFDSSQISWEDMEKEVETIGHDLKTKAQEFIPRYLEKEMERMEAWVEGDKMLELDSSMFLKEFEKLVEDVKMEGGGVEPLVVLTKYRDLKARYLKHRYEAIRHHLLNAINELRSIGADTEHIERMVNEADLIKMSDINKAISTLIHVFQAVHTTKEAHYSDLITQGLKSLHLFLDEARGLENIDLSPLEDKVKSTETALQEGEIEKAYVLLKGAENTRAEYEKALSKLKIQERLKNIEKKLAVVEGDMAADKLQSIRADITAVRTLVSMDKLDEATEDLKTLEERFEVDYKAVIIKVAESRYAEIEAFIKEKGSLLPEFQGAMANVLQKAKHAVEERDLDGLTQLKTELMQQYRNERDSYLKRQAERVVSNTRQMLRSLEDIIANFLNYLEQDEVVATREAMLTSNQQLNRYETELKREGGALAYYYALKSVRDVHTALNNVVSIIKNKINSDIEWAMGNMEAMDVDLSNINELMAAGMKRIDMGDYIDGLTMLRDAYSKMRTAIRHYYNKIVSYLLLSVENTIRGMESRGMDTSEVKALLEKGKEEAAEENWKKSERYLREAEEKARLTWNLFERAKLEPIVKEHIERFEALKAKGADLSDVESTIADLREAFEHERYEDVKALLPSAEDGLNAAERRYENEVAKLRYMRKKAEENIQIVKKEIIELKSLGYDVDEAEELLKEAEDALQEGNFGKSAQDSVRARQILSHLTKEFEEKEATHTIEKAEGLLERCAQFGLNLQKQMRMLEDAKTLFASEDYLGAKETAKNAHSQAIEEALKKLRERVETFLMRSEELIEKYKAHDIPTEELMEALQEIKNRAAKLEDSKAIEPLAKLSDDIRALISDAYSKYLDVMSERAMATHHKLEALATEMEKKGIDIGTIPQELSKALEGINKGNVEDAILLLENIEMRLKAIRSRYGDMMPGGEVAEIERKMAMEAYDILSECDRMFAQILSKAEVPSDDKAKAEILLEDAKKAFEEERWDVSYKKALKARDLMAPYVNLKSPTSEVETPIAIPEEIETLKSEIEKARSLGFDTTTYEDMLSSWDKVIKDKNGVDRTTLEDIQLKVKKAIEEIKGMYSMVDSTRIFLIKKAQRTIKEIENTIENEKKDWVETYGPDVVQEIESEIQDIKALLQSGDPVAANQKAIRLRKRIRELE